MLPPDVPAKATDAMRLSLIHWWLVFFCLTLLAYIHVSLKYIYKKCKIIHQQILKVILQTIRTLFLEISARISNFHEIPR